MHDFNFFDISDVADNIYRKWFMWKNDTTHVLS